MAFRSSASRLRPLAGAAFLTILVSSGAAAQKRPFSELRCTGVPDFPGGKSVRLDPGQIHESATAPSIAFVELDGAVGLTYYDVSLAGPKRLRGEATAISALDWSHRTAPVVCTIIR